ncbi:MAG: GTPase HflX [Victivallales bacterium]|nr:GTPase HflX [Victivallales bacterium]
MTERKDSHSPKIQLGNQEESLVSAAFLVGIQTDECGQEECAELLNELKALVDTLGIATVGQTIAKQREPNPRFLIGEGKTREICAQAERAGADVIVFDDILSPSQQRNWESVSSLPVIDRQQVILDIFAAHAHTSEAVLQIELARASYSLPRLKRRWTHLNRERGRAGGMGLRGGGEQQLELDSRLVRMRIARLRTQLADVQRHRQTQRSARITKPVPVAAIVGYTNAGKSSLLNAMTKAEVLVADKLFATLDPTVRRFQLPGGLPILLADTVGFVRKLPTLLVEAFHSTLEETVLADFILEVVDASSASLEEYHRTTLEILDQIGARSKDAILVFNKIDLLDELSRRRLRNRYPEAIFCSARTGEGLSDIAEVLERAVDCSSREATLLIPHARLEALARLRESSSILAETYAEDGAHIRARIPRSAWKIAEPYLTGEE